MVEGRVSVGEGEDGLGRVLFDGLMADRLLFAHQQFAIDFVIPDHLLIHYKVSCLLFPRTHLQLLHHLHLENQPMPSLINIQKVIHRINALFSPHNHLHLIAVLHFPHSQYPLTTCGFNFSIMRLRTVPVG